MKNLILILVIILASFSCNKNNSKSSSLNPTVYCMYSEDRGSKVYQGCAEGKDAMEQKAIALRNQGYTNVTSVKKNTCSECQ